MKHYIISIQGFEESPEGDIRQFACEEHKLILTPEETFVGVCYVYTGSKPIQLDQDS